MESRLIVGAAVLILLTACTTVPEPLRGDFAAIATAQGRTADAVGKRVRWGGELVEVMPKPDETCFELVDYPLDAAARPIDADTSHGRFIACAPGFYDPAVYAKGREVTVVGALVSPVSGQIGSYNYRYPRIAVETLYLWPQYTARSRSGYYNPFFSSSFYGNSFYGRGGFSRFGVFGRFGHFY